MAPPVLHLPSPFPLPLPLPFPRSSPTPKPHLSPFTSFSSSSDSPEPDSEPNPSPTSDSDSFESRLDRLRYRSGTGKKAEARKTRRGKSSSSSSSGSGSGSTVFLPPVPLKESKSGGLKVEFGFTPYSEAVNGRLAGIGLIALLAVELATGKGVINYHSPSIVFIQLYFMAAATAVFLKYDKEKVSVWPPPNN